MGMLKRQIATRDRLRKEIINVLTLFLNISDGYSVSRQLLFFDSIVLN